MIGAGSARGARRFIVWGRQNPTDVVSRAGDWIGFGVRRVIAPHSIDPLPEVDPTPQHPDPHPPVERDPVEREHEEIERDPAKRDYGRGEGMGPPPARRALSLGLDLAQAGSSVVARAPRGRPRKALG